MAVLTKPGDAWQDPEDIQTTGAGGVMESAKALREAQADGTWVDVWPTKLWLYRDGDECSEVTGGWKDFIKRNALDPETVYPTASFGATYIQFSGTDNLYGWGNKATFTSKILELSSYTKLFAKVTANHTNTQQSTIIGITSQNITWGTESIPQGSLARSTDKNLVNHLTNYVIELDISTIAEGYVYVSGYGFKNTVKITEVWLEI